MNIVVTGGSGFIGTNLLLALKNKYPNASIASFDIRNPLIKVDSIEYINGNVTNINTFDPLHKANKIFHLAALIGTHESFNDTTRVLETNLIGTTNILNCVKSNNSELFIAGMPGIWNNPYSISKDSAVRMAQSYYQNYGIKVAILRWFSVYGLYQYVSRYNKAVPSFIHQAISNKPITIYGSGDQIADFIFAEDAVNLAIEILEKKLWGNVIQCGSGVGTSVNSLANLIKQHCSSNSMLEHKNMRLGEPIDAVVISDNTTLNKLFDNPKMTSLEDGIKQTIQYYKNSTLLD